MAKKQTPHFIDDFKLEKFSKYLIENGAEIKSPTNPFEVIRFKANGMMRIIYKNSKGCLNYTDEAEDIYKAFLYNKTVSLCNRKRRQKTNSDIPFLLKRDGENCFFCLKELGEDITIEHLVPVSRTGNNHIANKVLAHEKCNKKAGNKTVIEKIKIREKNLLKGKTND